MPRPASERLSALSVLSHLGVMIAVSVVLGILTAGLALPFAGAFGLGAKSVSDLVLDLPAALKTEALPQRSQILDARGNVIATVYSENRVNVSLDQVSRKMTKAIVAIEDYRFYQHGALDLKGTLRALVTNQASGSVVQGGSSITQQMVKLTLVSQAQSKKERKEATANTFARKVRELRYAIAFEDNYSKDWILERYLNIAYFGDGAFGVQAAAKHYFNKNASDLDLRESALLAGIVKNPTGYDPTNSPDRALERRNTVLDRMAELNVISKKKAAKTKEMGLGLRVRRTHNGCVDSLASFFCKYVVEYLKNDPALGNTPREREELLETGGLTVHTTIDMRFQRSARAAVSAHVAPTDNAIGAIVMVEPRTGAVKAMAQSRPMGGEDQPGHTYLNYLVPKEYGDSAGFQAGSTFKAFVLAAAIKQGIPLSTTINSPETMTLPESSFKTCGDETYGYGTWTVSNSTDSGRMNLYTGTRLSVNTFFAQLEQRTGLCEPFSLAREMGVRLTQPLPNADGFGAERTPTFTLGVADVSPMEMAEAYATFAGRGLHCDSRPVTSIEDADGNLLKEYDPTCKQVLPSAVADAVNDVLRGVQEPGGFGYDAGLGLDQESAGKTGTTQDNKAVWFVGYTPNLATAAMIAGANSEGQPISLLGQYLRGSYVYSAHGSTTAGPMWGDAMRPVTPYLDDATFTAPPPDEIQGVLIPVPSVNGLSMSDAQARIEAAGFVAVVGEYKDSGYPADTVAYTYPSAGELFGSGDTVTIYPSDGTPYVPPKPKPPKGNGNGHGNGHGKPGRG